MTAMKTIAGMSLLCVLSLCAVSAPGASAAGGTTLVTCKKGGTTLDFTRAHCASADKVEQGKGTFSHFKVGPGVATALTGTNASTAKETKEATPWKLEWLFAAVEFEVSCTSLGSVGEIENQEPSLETHRIVGANIVLSLTGCTMPKPAAQACKITEGKITSNSLKSESSEDSIVITPSIGATLATVGIEGCKTAAFNGAKNFTGSIKTVPDGATWNVSIPRNGASPLEIFGVKAGLAYSETVRGKKVGGTETAEPLSATTTPLVLGG
jgi:hypothetical protein